MPGHWAGSNRRAQLAAEPDFPKRRRAALEAAGYRCQAPLPNGNLCGAPANQGDHVRRGDPTSPIQALCAKHHGIKSSREGNAARAKIMAGAKHKREKHPGIID